MLSFAHHSVGVGYYKPHQAMNTRGKELMMPRRIGSVPEEVCWVAEGAEFCAKEISLLKLRSIIMHQTRWETK